MMASTVLPHERRHPWTSESACPIRCPAPAPSPLRLGPAGGRGRIQHSRHHRTAGLRRLRGTDRPHRRGRGDQPDTAHHRPRCGAGRPGRRLRGRRRVHAGQRPAPGRAARRDEARWAGKEYGFAGAIGPRPGRGGGPEVILGGSTEAGFRRVAEFADGWITGGGSPDMFAEAAAGVDAWQKAGRAGTPRKRSPAYFGLGPEARTQADAYLLDHYGFLGDFARQIADSAAVSAEMVTSYVEAFAAGGCDELIFVPTGSGLDQIDLLAEAIT
ncbi:LLM class flavin-dependent oxidoreductase [Streptomyces sp. NPDC054837]